MKTRYLALVMKTPDKLFEPAMRFGSPQLVYAREPGDPSGFCPVFDTEDAARAAYPGAVVMPVVEAGAAMSVVEVEDA